MVHGPRSESTATSDVGTQSWDATGETPRAQLDHVAQVVGQQIKDQYQVLNRRLLPALKRQGFELLSAEDLSTEQKIFLKVFLNKNYSLS